MGQLPIKINLPNNYLDEEIRFGYVVSKERKAIWAVELDLYHELKRVCEKYDINLLADAGTILGAVRDSGFIPWDDDMDFSLTRSDYEKLCEVAENEFNYPYFWQTEETDPGSCRGHAQLRNTETTAIRVSEIHNGKFFGFNQGIFIDVFPFDIVPEDRKKRLSFLRKIRTLIIIRDTYRDAINNINPSTGVKGIIKALLMKYYSNKNYNNIISKKLEKEKSRYNESDSAFVANLINVNADNPDKLVRHKQWFEHYETIPFEFTTINVPCGYLEYLKHSYGDWHKRIQVDNVHGEMICDPYLSYKKYIDEHK